MLLAAGRSRDGSLADAPQLVEVAGQGSIVRVMTDRRTV